MPDDVSRDWRWADAPRPDPDTGTVPLGPTPAADDPWTLLAEAWAWSADRTKPLRSGLVVDLAHALRRALAEQDADANDGPCGWTTR